MIACFNNLSFSSSSAAATKLSHSQSSPSLPRSNHNLVIAIHSPPSLQALCLDDRHRRRFSAASRGIPSAASRSAPIAAISELESLKIMIPGAPASGKGTQCELIKKKMVKERLLQSDAQEKGWFLDGYPRSLSQAKALEDLRIRPDLFILLDVSKEILVERVVGRRHDPHTGIIYHLKFSPPENDEIAARLTQRFDDTEEKVLLRLQTHHQNVEDVLAVYKDIIYEVNGDAPMEEVFSAISNAISSIHKT